jgi:hypothetical protein
MVPIMRARWLPYLVAFLIVEGAPHIPPRAGKDKQRDLERAAKRSAHLDNARRADGVYEPGLKVRGTVRRALRRLRAAVARSRK